MKKVMKIMAIIVAILVIGLGVLMWMGSKPLTEEKAIEAIEKLLEKEVGKKSTVSSALVFVESPNKNFTRYFNIGVENGELVQKDQAFHVASVGKAFTATLIAILEEEGKLKLTDKVSHYIEDEMLQGLFVYEGHDYREDVTIQQLLNHTSGIADYFEDDTEGSVKMTEVVIQEPDTFFTPKDLMSFSKDHQRSIGAPGARYHYSDTGYILLGIMIEAITDQAFHEVLHERIFNPLGMKDSYLMFYSEPENPKREIADVWLEGSEISDYRSLSVDWAGGGIISTLDDLATFVKALNSARLVSEATLDHFYQFDYKFMTGLHYGNGFMEYHFGEYFPTLKSLPKYRGHMGILGTHMLYDNVTDSVYISSFGSTDYSAGSVKTMIKILSTIERIKD